MVLKVAFLPSCAGGAVLPAFSDAEDQPQTRRAKSRKTKFFRRLQVVMMPGLGRGEAPLCSARRVLTPHPDGVTGWISSSKTRTEQLQQRNSAEAHQAVIVVREAVKNFSSLRGRCASEAKGWRRREGRHNPES